jgi:hypothetical protein
MNCCSSSENSDKLEKLFTFLGIHICYECKGKGTVKEIVCQCCEINTITCPECKGEEFIIDDESILKSLIPTSETEHEEFGIGLCD